MKTPPHGPHLHVIYECLPHRPGPRPLLAQALHVPVYVVEDGKAGALIVQTPTIHQLAQVLQAGAEGRNRRKGHVVCCLVVLVPVAGRRVIRQRTICWRWRCS